MFPGTVGRILTLLIFLGSAPLALAQVPACSLIPLATGSTEPGVANSSPADCDSVLIEDDGTVSPTGRTPVILIHGICLAALHCDDSVLTSYDPKSRMSSGSPSVLDGYFNHLLAYLKTTPGVSSQVKIYRFQYKSNKHTISEIGRSLRNWIDYNIKIGRIVDLDTRGTSSQCYLIAHSMGGLVARSYMNEYEHDFGAYRGSHGGEHVQKLITLATPHHGTPIANGGARVSSLWHPIWSAAFTFEVCLVPLLGTNALYVPGFDLLWNANVNEPNRADMRWDQYDHRTWDGTYSSSVETNTWLEEIPHTYDSNIVAFYGAIGGGGIVSYYSADGPCDLQFGLYDVATNGLSLDDLLHPDISGAGPLSALGVVLQRIMDRNFDESNAVTTIANDGVVPLESASFDGSAARPVSCSGSDHLYMIENITCYDGVSLYKHIASEIGLTTSPPPLLAVTPDPAAPYGNVSIGNSSTKIFQLSNNGGSFFTVSSIGLTGASDFSIANEPAPPFVIGPNASQAVTVLFRPTTTANETASLTINSTTSGVSPKVISLTGTGVAVNSCTYTLSATTQSFGSAATNGSFKVTTGSGCAWTATSNDPWLPVTSGASGTGSQAVFFSVSSNPLAWRVGTVTVLGGGVSQTFQVSQDAPTTSSCVYSLSPSSQSIVSSASGNSVALVTSSTCGWSVTSDQPWLTVSTTGTHVGSGLIGYTAGANPSSAQRTGTITVTGQGSTALLSVTQAGTSSTCSYSLSAAQSTLIYQGGFTYFGIVAGSTCNWKASASDNWIAIQSGSYGTGNGQVQFNVLTNRTTSQRTGFVAVQGDTQTLVFTLTQLGQPNTYPSISLPTTSFNLGNALVGATVYQTVTIQNTGNATLYVGSIYLVSGTTEFSAPASIPSVPPSGTAFFTVWLTPTSPGSKTATFGITSNDPNNATVDVTVSATGITQGTGGIDFSWKAGGSVPETILEASVAQSGATIYLFANDAWKYDPTIPLFTPLSQSPINPIYGGAATIGTGIYLVSPNSAQISIYDTGSGNWTSGPTLPEMRTGPCVAAVGGKLYVIGGLLNGSPSAINRQFDPGANQWTQKAAMPTARGYGACAVVNNTIYVIGGQIAGNVPVTTTEAYDTIADQWITRESMPTARSLMGIVVLNNDIYVIGGLAAYSPRTLATVEEFDPSKADAAFSGTLNAWARRNPIASARYGASAAAVNGNVYVIGGQYLSDSSTYKPTQNIEVGTLTASPVISAPIQSASFGNVPLGNVGEQTLVIQNTGNAALTITDSGTGFPSDFSIVNLPSEIAAGASVGVRFRFTPSKTGAQTGTLNIFSNDPNTPTITLSFTANGTTAPGLPAGQSIQTSGTISVPTSPNFVTASGGLLYVTTGSSAGPGLIVIDPATGTLKANITMSKFPLAGFGLKPVVLGSYAYVPLFDPSSSGQLAVVDLTSNAVIQYIPVAVNPYWTDVWGSSVYVGNSACFNNGDPDVVQVVDSSTNTVAATIPVVQSATGLAIDPATGRGYVTGQNCGSIASAAPTIPQVLDANSNTITGSINAAYATQGLSIAGSNAYMLDSGWVDVVDISSNQIDARIPVNLNATRIAATSRFVFTGTTNGPGIDVTDTSSDVIVSHIPMADLGQLSADPTTNTVYATNPNSNTIAVITVSQPDFSVSCPENSAAGAPGGQAAFACSLDAIQSYAGTVTTACTGLPVGAACNFSPSTNSDKSQAFLWR